MIYNMYKFHKNQRPKICFISSFNFTTRLGTFRGFGIERARLGTFRGFGTERARLGTFLKKSQKNVFFTQKEKKPGQNLKF